MKINNHRSTINDSSFVPLVPPCLCGEKMPSALPLPPSSLPVKKENGKRKRGHPQTTGPLRRKPGPFAAGGRIVPPQPPTLSPQPRAPQPLSPAPLPAAATNWYTGEFQPVAAIGSNRPNPAKSPDLSSFQPVFQGISHGQTRSQSQESQPRRPPRLQPPPQTTPPPRQDVSDCSVYGAESCLSKT
jgi:hypothetical protein